MADRLPKLLAGLAVLLGVGVVVVGLSVFMEAWQASQAWAGSGHPPLADLPAEQPPLWLDAPPPPSATVTVTVVTTERDAPAPAVVAAPPSADRPPLRAGEGGWGGEVSPGGQHAEVSPPASTPDAPSASPADIELADADFRFLDPPEPGAHARLAVTLQNNAAIASGPLTVALSQRWLQAYTVLGAVPAVLDDQLAGDTERRFTFPGLAPGERQTVELHLIATADEVDAPEVRALLADGGPDGAGGEIAKAQPRTIAPRPRPGPARAVIVPKLGLRASVVPVAWEPPPFVIGQLQGSAAVSEGNTVLIGHLAGPQGDVFARLGQLRPGDEVTATSRGLEYRFVVSEIAVRPYDDVSPTIATETPRLTLMTCAGQWSVLRQDYSHRLWVVAEPPELAQQTIRANAARAAEAVREAEAASSAQAANEAEVAAQAVAAQAQTSAVPAPEIGAPPLPAPLVVASPAVATPEDSIEVEQLAPGIVVESPVDGDRVPQRLMLRGLRAAEADPRAPLWLLVRAELEGSRWYALGQPLEVREDGAWQADLELGGAAGIRHELRIGPADPETDALLRFHAAERTGQPLDDLPAGFKTGARVVVERR